MGLRDSVLPGSASPCGGVSGVRVCASHGDRMPGGVEALCRALEDVYGGCAESSEGDPGGDVCPSSPPSLPGSMDEEEAVYERSEPPVLELSV